MEAQTEADADEFLQKLGLLKRAFEAGSLDEDEYRTAKRVATSRMVGVPIQALTPSSVNTDLTTTSFPTAECAAPVPENAKRRRQERDSSDTSSDDSSSEDVSEDRSHTNKLIKRLPKTLGDGSRPIIWPKQCKKYKEVLTMSEEGMFATAANSHRDCLVAGRSDSAPVVPASEATEGGATGTGSATERSNPT